MISFQSVIDFWFSELNPSQWWQTDLAVDHMIAERFTDLHAAAASGELYEWRNEPLGSLAEIIVLDQFSRNLFRDHAKAFAQDDVALALAQQAIASNVHQHLPADQKAFLYMPYMHSESGHIHKLALHLFSEPGLEHNLRSELQHKAIIDRFGRYPHRNKVLGRLSTPEENVFLKQRGSNF